MLLVNSLKMMTPDYLLFAQHGWADTNVAIESIGKLLAPAAWVIAPNLGWWRTWWRIEPLINDVEQVAIDKITTYPETPMRIIGHSMGGLIWLEILHRHPEWWSKVHSIVLIASPIAGSDLSRLIDPFQIGIAIAKDLGINRRSLAESIAQKIPTLVIAGDIDDGSDGTIVVESTQFNHSQFICVNLSHPDLNKAPSLAPIIQQFWDNPVITPAPEPTLINQLKGEFRAITKITDAHRRDFIHSQPILTFKGGVTLRRWQNMWGVNYIFISDEEEQFCYGGFVGLLDGRLLDQVLAKIKDDYQEFML